MSEELYSEGTFAAFVLLIVLAAAVVVGVTTRRSARSMPVPFAVIGRLHIGFAGCSATGDLVLAVSDGSWTGWVLAGVAAVAAGIALLGGYEAIKALTRFVVPQRQPVRGASAGGQRGELC